MTVWTISRFFKKHHRLILLAGAVGVLGGLLFAREFPVTYEASQTVFVKRQTSPPSSQFYAYDGYYSAQAAERFTDSIFGGLKSSEVLRFLLLKAADGSARPKAVDETILGIKIKRLSPQLIGLSYRDRNLETSQKVIERLSQGLLKLSEKLSRGGDESLALEFINETPQLSQKRQSLVLDGLVGFLLAGFFSATFFLIRDYLLSLKT